MAETLLVDDEKLKDSYFISRLFDTADVAEYAEILKKILWFISTSDLRISEVSETFEELTAFIEDKLSRQNILSLRNNNPDYNAERQLKEAVKSKNIAMATADEYKWETEKLKDQLDELQRKYDTVCGKYIGLTNVEF
jgi:hypothetical protein